jgi:hypothetical protein
MTPRSEPLVAVVCRVPLLSQALTAALEGIASVSSFPAGRGDTDGLLRALAPDAVIVDTRDEARQAEAFASETRSPLVHVSLRERRLQVLENGRWRQAQEAESAEAIRNALVDGMFRRERAT